MSFQSKPPPKKSKGLLIGLIIGGVLLVAVIIVVVILLLRRKKTTTTSTTTTKPTTTTTTTPTTTTTCTDDTQCGGTKKKCKVSTGKCVTCLTAGDCTSPQTCNTTTNTCISPQCSTAQDCVNLNPANPICSAGVCLQCLNSSQCASNPITVAAGNLTCDPSTTKCVMCLTAADCGGSPNTCVSGACCYVTPPTITGVTINMGTVSSLVINYSFGKSLSGLTVIAKVSLPVGAGYNGEFSNGEVIFTSGALPTGTANTTGTITLTETTMNTLIFPVCLYGVSLQIITTCGSTNFSPIVFQIAPYTYPSSSNNSLQAITTSNATFFFGSSSLVKLSTLKCVLIASKTNLFHPNLATVSVVVVPSNPPPASWPNPAFHDITAIFPWPAGTVVNSGDVWYVRGFFGPNALGPGSPAPQNAISVLTGQFAGFVP